MHKDTRYLFIDTHRIRQWDTGIYQRFPKPEKVAVNGLEPGPSGSWDARGPEIYGTVLKEEGCFRMWYCSMPDVLSHGEAPDHFYSCYAESDDGVNWRKPDLKVTGKKRYPGNNLLSLPGAVMGVVPTLPGADAKYLAVVMQYDFEEDISEGFGYEHHGCGTYIYASDDGIHWRQHKNTPVISYGDNVNLVADPVSGRYLLHQKILDQHGLDTRRAFCFMESSDGINWRGGNGTTGMVPWQESLQCDDYDDIQAMQSGYRMANHYDLAVYRAGGTYISVEDIIQIGDPIVMKYSQSFNGSYMFRLGFSHDGIVWRYPKGRPTWLEPGIPGDWDAGFAVPANTFVEHEDHLLLYYAGCRYVHGWCVEQATDCCRIRQDIPLEEQRNLTNIMIAKIRKDRFASLAATHRGRVRVDAGPREENDALFLNARCPAGSVRLAIADLRQPDEPLPGFSLEDCIPFCGDATCTPINFRDAKWHDIPADIPLMLNFEITSGEVFGYEWK